MPLKKTFLLLPVWGILSLHGAAPAQDAQVPVCVHDESVKERFLPVELLTGNPMTESRELVFAPVDRVYPFIDELPNGSLGKGEAALKGPISWEGQGGVTYEIYERKVPRAHERFALTPDRTAIGRVYDQRFGNATNEGKFPVGMWSQGQTRRYSTTYFSPRGTRNETSSVEIEKLSCTYEGIPGAVQYGWKTSGGLSYGYIYAPGKGLVHVMTRAGGR
ncbi:MAG: hypothetical protein O9327_07635 [Polaromonas sp.]|nr:hypothetical protein [Polaromonas sp.]